jgi:PleD family two-component response regulator
MGVKKKFSTKNWVIIINMESVSPNKSEHKIKVLIVDDDQVNRRLLKGILETKFNFEVLEAPNGKVGLQLIEQEKPFLVMLDVMMPEMDGVQMLSEIRKKEETKDIPVIICSSVSDKGKVIELFNQGIGDYILKPIKPIILVNKISGYLREYLSKLPQSNVK